MKRERGGRERDREGEREGEMERESVKEREREKERRREGEMHAFLAHHGNLRSVVVGERGLP